MKKLESILDALRRELAEGKYARGSRFPSEYELSERFAVNKKTANKAVSLLVAEGALRRGSRGQGTRVAAASMLRKEQIAFIGNITLPYYAEIYHGLQAAALERRYLVSYLSPPLSVFGDILKMLPFSPVRGIVTHGYGTLLPDHIPVIHLDHDHRPNEPRLHTISCNNYQGGYEIMQELIARGHRDIVIYFHPTLMRERLTGFYQAMREGGISDCEERTFYSMEHSDFDAKTVLKRILRKYPGFTALVTGSDLDLLRMVRAMGAINLPWAGKIALTGFGNVAGISNVLPMATIDQHPYRLGRRAAECLIDMIEHGQPPEPVHDILDVEILNAHHIPILNRNPP